MLYGAWRFPTFAWQTATLSSALGGFTSEFGMGSGGSRPLWSPSSLVHSPHSRAGLRRPLPRPPLPASPTVGVASCRQAVSGPPFVSAGRLSATPRGSLPCPTYGNLYLLFASVLSTVGKPLQWLGFWPSPTRSLALLSTQAYWVLYGQASRAISTR